MKGYYEIKKADGGDVHFTLHASNHEVILGSEVYSSKAAAQSGIESARENGPNSHRFERRLSSIGEPYFVLKAANGQVIGSSEMYGSEASRDDGVHAVMGNSPTTVVKDLTA